jgi:hypothetical protein
MPKFEQGPQRLYAGKYMLTPMLRFNGHSVSPAAGDSVTPFEEHSAQKFPLGTRLDYGDRSYRYCLADSTAIATGKLCQSGIIEANGDVTDMAVDTPAVGATSMEVTNGSNTTIAADEFAEGWLHVNDGTGEGYAYRVKGNDAMSTSTAGTVFLYDSVRVALVAASTVSLTHSKYYGLIIHPSPPTAQIVGVTNIAVTASYYFWAQTKGPCAVLDDSSSTANAQGALARASEDDDGGVALLNYDESAINLRQVGTTIHLNADGEHSLIDLNLE